MIKIILHTTLMDLWQRIFEREMVPSGGFGSIIKKSGVEKNKWLQGAGSCIFLPVWNKEHENTLTIPAGEYVCMYKYGMPYDTEHLEKLMQWLAKIIMNWQGISSTCVCLILPFISRKQA